MAKDEEVKVQSDEIKTSPSAKEEAVRTARRQFLRRALAVSGGLVVSELIPFSVFTTTAQAQTCPPAGVTPFQAVTAIESDGNVLEAVMKVVSGKRSAPTSPRPLTLRFYEGYNPNKPAQKWPTNRGVAGPGPTLRCEIGDKVQITFLNQVKSVDFPNTPDAGQEHTGNGCDKVPSFNQQTGVNDPNWYPANDTYPNCFHGSSSANIHFHGTHVTPSGTGDNVLVNVRPDEKVTEADVKVAFQQIFKHCELGHEPTKWTDLPPAWRIMQRRLVKNYDQTAPYVGPGSNKNGHGLPEKLQLWPQNQAAILQGVWPQWYMGSYPYCFQIPKYEEDKDGNPIGVKMGQAPGTHWYHSHKHGSTSINLLNGLAGALIITDTSATGYDGKLQAFYNKKLDEKVLVLQQITGLPNLLSPAPAGAPKTLVNGQLTPTITMQKGQVQLFRIINATVQAFVSVQFNAITSGASPIQFRQTAQDGVQLAWENYSNPQNGQNPITMAPANRVDILVQAPQTAGCYVLGTTGSPLLYVNVENTAANPPMTFPASKNDYPKIPNFLNDIKPETIRLRREITYSAKPGTAVTTGGRAITQFFIDGKQFEDQVINQVMLLDTAEEWTLFNTDTTTNIAHPFHIHINPFQIFEVYNPNTMTQPLKLTPPFVWWDTFAIPPGKVVNGQVVPGYFKMRSRFVDFTGAYVQHCHILAHEDRGMMQLLEVVSNKTVIRHH